MNPHVGPSLPDLWALLDRLSTPLWHVGTAVAVLSLLAEIPNEHPDAAARHLGAAFLGAVAGLYYAVTQAGMPWLPTGCYGLGALLPIVLRTIIGRGAANVLSAVCLLIGWFTMPR